MGEPLNCVVTPEVDSVEVDGILVVVDVAPDDDTVALVFDCEEDV